MENLAFLQKPPEAVKAKLHTPRSDNVFYLRYALQLGMSVAEVHDITGVDPWFLHNVEQIVRMEERLREFSV